MAWNNGNPHYIASLAHLDCKGVSPQNVWIPMEANYSVSGRSYTITVKLYMWWNKRIRLYMTFHDMSINGTNFGNKNIVGWVDKPLEFGSATYHGTFDKNGNPDRADWTFNGSGFINVYTNVGCSRSRRVDLSNSINLHIDSIQAAYTKPGKPAVNPVSATDTSITADASVNDFGVGVKNALYVQASETNFGASLASPSISSKSGQMTVPNLSRNTRYYVRSVADNGGMSNVSDVKEKVTLAASEVLELFAVSPTQVDAKVAVYNGSGYYKPTTYVEISSDNGEHWVQQGSTKSTTVATVPLTPLVANKRYWVRTKTVTTAGTYYSDMKPVTTPRFLTGRINNVTPTGSEAIINVTASSSACADIVATPYYRIKGVGDAYQAGTPVNMKSGQTVDLRISDLLPNYITYEIYVKFKDCADNIYDTEPVDFATISSIPVNHNCESLNYMVDLICQSLEAIKEGNITVFANDDTKTWCEEEDDDTPTLASMLSRVTRFMQAVSCILCSMGGLMAVKHGGKPGQVFMGQLGWQNMDGKPTEGSGQLVSSNAVYEAVQNVIHSVWHPFGIYDFYGYDLAELQTQKGVKNGQTGVVGGKVYTWNGTAWDSPKDINADNFGVIHINYGKYEREAFYWFGNSWSRLNADTDKIEKWIDLWEDVYPVYPESGAYLEVEGNPIEIKNAIDAPIHKLEVDGAKSTQDKPEGYNLLNVDAIISNAWSGNTLTNNGDGSITLSIGEASPDVMYGGEPNNHLKDFAPTLQADKTYTLQIDGDNTRKELYLRGSGRLWQYGTSKTIYQSDLDNSVGFYASGQGSTATLRNFQIVEGDKPKPFEPYTGGQPAPNPSYPQEIKHTRITSISDTGKNLSPTEGMIATWASTWEAGLMALNSLPAGDYTLSFTAKQTRKDPSAAPEDRASFLAWGPNYSPYVNVTTTWGNATEVHMSGTFTILPEQVGGFNFLRLYGRGNDNVGATGEAEFYIQIETGDKETPYESPKGGVYELSKPIDLYGLGDVRDSIEKRDGVWGVMRRTGKVTVDGSDTWKISPRDNGLFTCETKAYSPNIVYTDTDIICNAFKPVYTDKQNLPDGAIYCAWTGLILVRYDAAGGDPAAIQQYCANSPIVVIYKLNTPAFEPLPEADQAIFENLHSFSPTTILATQGKMRVQYAIDLKEYQGDASEVIVDNYVVATANVSASDADLMSSVPTNPNKDTIIYILEDE